jgi:hypothetical protein
LAAHDLLRKPVPIPDQVRDGHFRDHALNAAIIANLTNQAPEVRRQGMLARLLATLVKVAVASLIVGTILAHFGITADQILKDFGITPERLAEMMRQGFAWALPNLLLGSLIIVPIWLLVFLFRPPGARSE